MSWHKWIQGELYLLVTEQVLASRVESIEEL